MTRIKKAIGVFTVIPPKEPCKLGRTKNEFVVLIVGGISRVLNASPGLKSQLLSPVSASMGTFFDRKNFERYLVPRAGEVLGRLRL